MLNEQKNDNAVYEIISVRKADILKCNIESIKIIDSAFYKSLGLINDIYLLVKGNQKATSTDLVDFQNMIERFSLRKDLSIGIHTEFTLNQKVQKSYLKSEILKQILKNADSAPNLLELKQADLGNDPSNQDKKKIE